MTSISRCLHKLKSKIFAYSDFALVSCALSCVNCKCLLTSMLKILLDPIIILIIGIGGSVLKINKSLQLCFWTFYFSNQHKMTKIKKYQQTPGGRPSTQNLEIAFITSPNNYQCFQTYTKDFFFFPNP